MYNPGTHIIATLACENKDLLTKSAPFKERIDALIAGHQLTVLGEVYHDFEPEGYTGVICLSESHVSIHTWPESNRINVDVYLSNHKRTNDGTVRQIYNALIDFFSATIVQEQTIKR